jgi:hypothetical protein
MAISGIVPLNMDTPGTGGSIPLLAALLPIADNKVDLCP